MGLTQHFSRGLTGHRSAHVPGLNQPGLQQGKQQGLGHAAQAHHTKAGRHRVA